MLFIYNPKTQNHLFLIEMIKQQLQSYSIIVQEIHEINEQQLITSEQGNQDHIYLLFLNFYFLLDNPKIQKEFQFLCQQKYKILYITEPIQFLIDKQLYQTQIRKLRPNLIFTYSQENCKLFPNQFSIMRFFPIDHHYLNFNNISSAQYLQEKNTSNLLFIGKINEYRKNILCSPPFKNVKIIEDAWTKDSWALLLKKYLFFINLHRIKENKCLELMRIVPILYNGGIVISSAVNQEEIREFKDYNIYFCDQDKNIYDMYLQIKQTLNYEEVYRKMILFRQKENNDIEKIIQYLNKIKSNNIK
jgi:hypothetical protein